MNLVSVVALSVALAVRGSADEPAGCPQPRSAQEVLDCALRNHPSIRRATAALAQADYLESIARQRPNPELEAREIRGKSGDESLDKAEGSLRHTFELGGKRRSRAERARADRRFVAADVLKVKEDVAAEIVLALHRLRQSQAEIAILQTTEASLRAIQAQLRTRPRLTPEQEASLEVFQLAEADAKLRSAALEGERAALVRGVELALSRSFEPAPILLPRPRESWPALPDVSPSRFAGSESLRAEAEMEGARADLSVARGSSFPDLKIGPAVERDAEGSNVKQAYGLSLGLPLPLYQRNAAGREYAARGVQAAQIGNAAAQARLEAERQAELARYRAAVDALQAGVPAGAIEEKLRRAQERSRRGLIPSSLIVESYRQIFELTRNRHDAELSAVRSLWRIYAIEGRILTEKL